MEQPNSLKRNNNTIWVERISRLMDSQFRLPGTDFRFGLDPIINLVPVLGDVSGFVISSALLLSMVKHGVSRKVVIVMVLNILVDAIIGGIPLIGQIFDFYFKANSRNLKLLKEHYEEGKHQGSGTGVLIGIGVALLIIMGLIVYLAVLLSQWLFEMF